MSAHTGRLAFPGIQVREVILSEVKVHCFHRFVSNKVPFQKMRLSDLVEDWTKRFQAEQIPDPVSSTDFIIAHCLGKKTLHNVSDDKLLDQETVSAVQNLCKKRLERMPVQYILGEWDFGKLNLKMAPPVFIPRPETEELVEYCIEILESCMPLCEGHPKFLEFCCGSGAISLSLLNHFKQLRSVCVDISATACNLTQTNAERVGVSERIYVINGDFTDDKVLTNLQTLGPFCCIVSNPPYVTCEEMKTLAPEITRYEDLAALRGGTDGLDLVREILCQSPQLVVPDGHVVMEVGETHPVLVEQHVREKFRSALQYVETRKDSFDKNRFCHMTMAESKPE